MLCSWIYLKVNEMLYEERLCLLIQEFFVGKNPKKLQMDQ